MPKLDGVTHGVWTSQHPDDHSPLVCMSNDEDSYYVQYFESREEVDALIAELEQARDQCWPVVDADK